MINFSITIPGGSNASVTDGDISFSFPEANYNVARLITGDWCVIAPAGVKVATSPAFGTVGTRSSNGAMLNPTADDLQPFDTFAGNYTSGLAHDETTILRPGDVLSKMTGIDPAPTEARDGVTEQWSALHVVASAPAANAVSPAVWTGPNRPWDTMDVESVLADLPSYSATGDEVAWSSLKPIVGRRNLGAPMDGGGVLAYQELTPNAMGDGSSNYGSYLSIRYNKCRIGLLSNTWSSTDKVECALALATLGYELWRARTSAGTVIVDGGHYHWEPDLMLLGIKATGNLASYAAAVPYLGNVAHQPFLHDASTLAMLTPHEDTSLPYIYRLRAITTVTSDTQFTVAHSAVGDQGDKTRFAGGIAVRERDGAEAVISASVQVGPDNAITGWNLTLATPMTGTTTSDRIHVKPAFTVTAGMPDWCIRGVSSPRWINPLPLSAYRQENETSMAHRLARALGMVGSGLAGWDQYVLHAETGVNGLPSPIHSGSAAFIAAHSTAILALPQDV